MGEVYRARDPKLGRTVAIKTVKIAGLDPVAEEEYRRRFVIEAQAAGRLSHPGIVTIFDVGEEGTPYLVMEYVDGQSLQHLVSRENRTLPLSTTLRLVQEVAEALHYAHSQGVVHRDIKPANILVTPDGHPKIADFGIAKLNQSELTLPGQVLGSPAFMAPEQLNEEGVDSRSDLFSLGVIFYYMLTGHRPFQGNSTTTVCFKLVNHEPVPVSVLESKIPRELDKIVQRAMAKDPADRYQTGMAMASDIQEVRERSGFLQSADWAESSKRDAIPRYVKGGSAGSESPGREPRQEKVQGAAVADGKSAQAVARKNSTQKKKTLLSKAILVFLLLLIPLVGVAWWNSHSSSSYQIDPIEPPHPPDKLTVAVETDTKAAKTEPAPAKIAKHRAKAPIAQASASIPKAIGAIPAASAAVPADATLQIEIEHRFASATASVWVDDALVYTQSLQGDKKRRALFFKKVVGHQFQVVRVAPGKHQVRVRIQSDDNSYDQSKISSTTFAPGISLLRIVCDDSGKGLVLDFQKEGYQ
jgi:serine/threonine protein kinase